MTIYSVQEWSEYGWCHERMTTDRDRALSDARHSRTRARVVRPSPDTVRAHLNYGNSVYGYRPYGRGYGPLDIHDVPSQLTTEPPQ